jgi:hypothetical protein
MVSNHLELAKRHARDRYGRFASPSSCTAPPPSCHEVGSSTHHCTAPPPSCMHEVESSSHRHTAHPSLRQEEASSDDSVEMWVAAPPPLHLHVSPLPPSTCMAAPPPPPLTHVEESPDDSPSDSSGYNDECPHIKEVSSHEQCF